MTTTSRTPSMGLKLNLCLKRLGISCESLKCSQNILRRDDQANLSEELALTFAPPSRELADTMVDLYCTSFESVYRIIHVPSFRSEYQRYWDNPESATASQCLKILLEISIGSSLHDYGNTTTGLRQKVQQWVHAAQAWLSGPLEKDRLDVTGLQVYCLVILARQLFSISGDLVWVSTGSVIRMAMQIGLHHDPKHLPAMSLLQAELRRRLWATVLEMAIQSADSAMPPIISLNHFDTEAPSNYNDDEIDESTIELVPHPTSTYTTSSTQLILLDSIPTRLRILELLSGLKSRFILPGRAFTELGSD
ncbi:Transcription factor [Penicillium viridicatum]|nr:Transcription factor [Penicillium viridicatum]